MLTYAGTLNKGFVHNCPPCCIALTNYDVGIRRNSAISANNACWMRTYQQYVHSTYIRQAKTRTILFPAYWLFNREWPFVREFKWLAKLTIALQNCVTSSGVYVLLFRYSKRLYSCMIPRIHRSCYLLYAFSHFISIFHQNTTDTYSNLHLKV
jgi:hypothetical protein